MGFALEKYCTVEDFYNMPEDIRAEPIDGEIVYRTSQHSAKSWAEL